MNDTLPPPFCGQSQMRIGVDGTWYYQESPILRKELVKLFASILHAENNKFFLITPVEKLEIQVDDAPFIATTLEVSDKNLKFTINMGNEITASATHPLIFNRQTNNGFIPYCLVRNGLWARITRSVYTELVDLGVVHTIDKQRLFGVWSSGTFFSITDAAELDFT